jgi:hypothetical protein
MAISLSSSARVRAAVQGFRGAALCVLDLRLPGPRRPRVVADLKPAALKEFILANKEALLAEAVAG